MKRKANGSMYVPIRSKYQRRAKPRALTWTRSTTSKKLDLTKPSEERKTYDINEANYQVNTTGSFTLLHIPVLGTDFTNRIGRKTFIKNVYIRGRISMEAAFAGTTGNEVAQQARLILFIDMQPNGATPALLDLLKEATPSSQLNLNNRDRFRIIKDKEFIFDPVVNNGTIYSFNRTSYNIKIFKALAIETIYNSTNGGTIADINSGALYMFWIGSSAAGTNTDSNAIVSTRTRFVDA